MTSGEFSGPELVTGTMVGLRQFRVTNNQLWPLNSGYGIGLGCNTAWTDGENHATCWKFTAHVVLTAVHRIAEARCTCGFYAYHRDELHRSDSATLYVTGIIEGYGRVTVGSKGFRAEKARILALIGWRVKFNRTLRRRYPNARTFWTRKRALRKFPLSTFAGQEPLPPKQRRRREPWVTPIVSYMTGTVMAVILIIIGFTSAAFLASISGLLAACILMISAMWRL